MRRAHLVVGILGAAAGFAGCGGTTTESTPAAFQPLAMTITDEGCDRPTLEAPTAGAVKFSVVNRAAKRGEFEIVSSAPSIIFEGFFEPGQTKDVTVQLRAGAYEVICGNPNTPTRARLAVGPGSDSSPTLDAQAAAAVSAQAATYTTYVRQQADELLAGTRRFTAAVRSGDVARAKSLYADVREPWERIEPIAEAFPDADAAIDSRADDHPQREADPGFVGFHAIEYGLWAQGSTDGATVNLPALADRLDADVLALTNELRTLEVEPAAMTNGAAALIEEAAQTKVTGEEERYSRTDLSTLSSNIDGSRTVFALVEDELGKRDPQLRDDIRLVFRKARTVLSPYDLGSTFTTYEKVTPADRNRLKTTLADLSELLARVPGALGLEVTS